MKINSKNNSLTKKVLFSIVAAGVLSGFVMSAEAAEPIYINNGSESRKNVDVPWIFVARFDTNPNPVSLTLNGGKVTGGNSKITDGDDVLTIGEYLFGSDGYPHTQSQTNQRLDGCDVAAYAQGIGSLIEANDVAFRGAVAVDGSEAKIKITGGSITSGTNYYRDPTTSEPKSEDHATYVTAFNKGKIELTNVAINSNMSAYSGGVITATNSNINAAKEIRANGQEDGQQSVINISFNTTDANGNDTVNAADADTKGTIIVASQILAEAGATINITNANITVTKQYGLNKNGTIEATGKDSTGNGSKITLNNSDITADNLVARNYGTLILDNKSSATVSSIAATPGSAGASGTIEIYGNFTTNDLSASKNGKIYLQGGDDAVYKVTRDFFISDGGELYIKSGTLEALANGAFKIIGTQYNKIFLEGTGVISTISENIYTNAASAIQHNPGGLQNNGIVYNGGELILNDTEYTEDYLEEAKALLGNNTKLTMANNPVDDNGQIKDTMSTDQINKGANKDINFNQLKVIGKGNLLVGSDMGNRGKVIDGINVRDTVENGFGAGFLDLGTDEGANSVIILKKQELTLGGSLGGNLITVNGKDVDDIKVVVGITEDIEVAANGLYGNYGYTGYNGTLNIGNAMATADTQYKISGEVVVNKDSNLNIKGQTEIAKSLTLNDGTVDVKIGSLTTKALQASGAAAKLLGKVNADKLTLNFNSDRLLIGDNEKAGKLTVKNAELNGGMVFLDPDLKAGTTISNASGLAVTDVSTALDGAYVAGRNSVLSFGAELTAAEEKFAKTGYTWGKGSISAAAYIADSVDLGTGSITVNGSLSAAPTAADAGTGTGKLALAANSMLIVDAEKTQTDAAIKGVSTADIASGSTLFIDDAKKDNTYYILDGTVSNIKDAWEEDAVKSNNSLLKFTKADVAGQYTVTASMQSINEVFGAGQVVASNAYDAALGAQDDGDAAYDFIISAADSRVNGSKAAQASALNSAAALGELAGVEHSTYAASNLLTDAVAEHLSLANEKEHDSDIWAKYIHAKENIDGLAVAGFGAKYDAQYNGIVVGADLYKQGKAAVGAALTYVDGSINGNSLAARTKNDAAYYGASVYGGIQNGDSAVLGDISYLHGKHDITQYNSGKTLTADAKADAFSLGVRAEKSVQAGAGKFVLYAGLRYMHLGTGNYTSSIGMSYDGDDMNLWLLPVGVKYSAEVKTGGWTIRPLAEVGYVWNMGDRDAAQTVSLNGASDGFGFDVTDSGSYIGRFAVEAQKANVTYGLGYEYQKGDSVKANRWTANLNWSF